MAKKKKSVKKGLIIGISSVVVLLAAAYAGVGYYFHDHFYPGTVINETNFPRQRRPGLLYQWIGY